jgi:hypothetical protein
MRRRSTGGNTDVDGDGINLPWFLTMSRGHDESHSPRQRGGGRGIFLLLIDLGFIHPWRCLTDYKLVQRLPRQVLQLGGFVGG